jgi:hypothetical protein
MSRKRASVAQLFGLTLTGIVIAGCTPTLEGTATGADDAEPSTEQTSPPSGPLVKFSWLTSVLPSTAELTGAVGHQIRAYDPPTLGDVTRMRNTIAGSQSLTEGQCLGVASPFEGRVYEGAPIEAVTYATESTVTFGAVALATEDDARRLFEKFQEQWQQCRGTTIVTSDGADITQDEITNVDSTSDVVAAVELVTSNSPTGVLVRSARALGVAKDCIVEAEVPTTDPSFPLPSDGKNAAVAVVEAMLVKVRAARP